MLKVVFITNFARSNLASFSCQQKSGSSEMLIRDHNHRKLLVAESLCFD
jgi:hypothetical protein